MAKSKAKKKPPRPEGEAELDRTRVLRRPQDIEPGHWCSGIAPGGCETCNLPDTRGGTWEPEDWWLEALGAVAEVEFSPDAYRRGLEAAQAASGVSAVLHEALLEREDDEFEDYEDR